MRRLLPDRTTLLALCSGLALALSFPRVDLGALAWVGFVPLLLVMERRPFRSGFAAGVAFYALVLYWLNIVMTTYGHLPPALSVVAYLLLCAYLALYFGVCTWACCRLKNISGLSPVLTFPVLWVALEFCRSFMLTGFPWASLGYSQQGFSPLIQSADLFGVYGISFLLVLANAAFAQLVAALKERRLAKKDLLGTGIALCLFLLNLGYGTYQLQRPLEHRERQMKVALVQGNIDQGVKWNPGYQKTTIDIYSSLSLDATRESSVDLVVWPESATPFYFQERGPLSSEVRQVAKQSGAHLLFGSPAYTVENRSYRYLNSAFLLSEQGATLGRSDKIHLVPFGEYVPLGRYLPFINKLVVGIGDFSPGTVSPLPMNGERAGVLVCFEGIFPELARDYVRKGSDFLVNITNDAWFGRSSAPFQHLVMTRFRAIENRVWVVRAANTGISALISPSGRVVGQTPVFERTVLTGPVGMGTAGSLYTEMGDLVPTVFCFVSLWWLVQTRRRYGRG